MNEEIKPCPCQHTTPCKPQCTCANPFMSGGCDRCCTYGSKEQQLQAEWLAKVIDKAVMNVINDSMKGKP